MTDRHRTHHQARIGSPERRASLGGALPFGHRANAAVVIGRRRPVGLGRRGGPRSSAPAGRSVPRGRPARRPSFRGSGTATPHSVFAGGGTEGGQEFRGPRMAGIGPHTGRWHPHDLPHTVPRPTTTLRPPSRRLQPRDAAAGHEHDRDQEWVRATLPTNRRIAKQWAGEFTDREQYLGRT